MRQSPTPQNTFLRHYCYLTYQTETSPFAVLMLSKNTVLRKNYLFTIIQITKYLSL
jgi:hypothetical protein